MSKRIGLIGLGTMGVPMAKNIAAAGFPLTVFNRSPRPLSEFKETEVRIADSVQEVIDDAEQIILMLNTEAAFDEVLKRRGGEIGVSLAGKTIVNTATLTPQYSKALGRDILGADGRYVEAPVSGSRAPAEVGELVVMTAGDPGDVEAAKPIFEAIGKSTFYCGAIPNAMAMKSATSVLLAGVMGGLAEAVSFARGVGLDLELFAEVIFAGPMANEYLKMKFPRAMAEDYSPQATIKNVASALDIMIETAKAAHVEIPQAAAMRGSCEKALRAGFGEEDILALVKILGAPSGVGEA